MTMPRLARAVSLCLEGKPLPMSPSIFKHKFAVPIAAAHIGRACGYRCSRSTYSFHSLHSGNIPWNASSSHDVRVHSR
jgi:hypothetical protein